jgi:hypothetical protein
MPARIGPQLNASYQRFAGLLAIGHSQTDAYRECFTTKGRTEDAIKSAAHKAANNPHVKSYAKAIVEQLNISAIDSANQAVIELIQDIKRCRDAGKWAALAALTRLRLQVHGILKENLNVTAEQQLSDAELIKRLSGNDPALAAMLQGMLAPTSTFKRA